MKTYSQHGEDLFLIGLFDATQGGHILDIGANDGVTYSNSRLLIEDYGWNAVLIEPTTACIERLNNLYQDNSLVTILPYAVSSEEGEATIFLGNLEPDTVNQVSTLSTQEKLYWETNRHVQYNEEIVKTKTIKQLVDSVDCKHYNIISIDTEGSDILAFRGLYDLGFRPEFYIFEHNSNNSVIEELLSICSTDYKVIWKNTINYILQRL